MAYILIPAYQPDQRLISLVNELLSEGMNNIIVVNDGSGEKYNKIFSELPDSVVQLEHEKNQGKGSALKTGFEYVMKISPFSSVITVDADGQHLAGDVKKIYDATKVNSNSYILGVRSFDKKTPLRSRLGNELTKKLCEILYGLSLKDTQTGLRSTPAKLIKQIITIPANRYEFELECLLITKQNKIDIVQIPINTVYIENNQSSHFNPLMDSIRVYSVLFSRWLTTKQNQK